MNNLYTKKIKALQYVMLMYKALILVWKDN
jgi:hypothetical protein